MITVAEMGRRIQGVDFELVITQSIEETNKEFLDLQTEQMYEGVLSTGQPITPEYTSRTVEIKKQKGQVYDHVTLNDTNAFFEQMYAQVDNDQINIDSPVPYEPELVEKYGPEIYGLDDENREEYIDDALFPKVKQKVEEQTKLNF